MDNLTEFLASEIIDFENQVLRLSEVMNQKPEEVIRQLVNHKWDIKDCLDYKDIIIITEWDEMKNK